MRNLRHHHPFVLVRLLVAGLLALVVAGAATTASAGGWAVTSLDALPAPTAGESADVGFTILQHGGTPAVLESGVGLELVLPDGATEFFPAVAEGAPGHYVATVTFPASAGSYEWRAHMDWFGTYELGSVDVAAPSAASAGSGGGSSSAWADLRWIMLTGAILLGGVAVADMVVSRHRRRAMPA